MHVLLTAAAAETDAAACMYGFTRTCMQQHQSVDVHMDEHTDDKFMHMHMATWRISLDIDCRSIEPLCWLLSEPIQETWLVAVSTTCRPRC